MEEAGGGLRSEDETHRHRGSYERRSNDIGQATSGPSAALSLLKPPGTSLTSTSPTTSGSLLATGNIVVISVDPKSTLRPLFIDDADGTLEKSAGEMQIKAKKYLAFVRNVEHTTTTVTTTTMMAVPMEEEGVEDQDVTIRRPSVASTIKGIEKKITTTTTRVHLNLLHTAIPTRSRYDTVDETMNVPLALYHSRSAARSRLTDNSTVISDRDPLRVRNGHGLFRKYKHLYAHTIMDAYAVVSEVTHSPEIETSNTKLYTTRRNRVPSISRRDLKRYDMYQKIDRIKESNQFVTSNSPTTPTTPSTPASLSSPRYQSTTRRLGKTSTQSIALLSSQGGVQEEGESDFGEDEGEAEEAPHLGDNEDEDLHEDEDEDDEDDGSQFRLSTVISSLSVDNEGSSAPWADPSHRLSPNGRSVSSSSSPSVSRASSLRKRRGGGSAAPSAWKTTKSGSGRRSSRSPQPHQQPSSLSTNDDSPRSTSPRDSASPSPPSLSSPPTKSTISLKIPSPPSLPRSPTPVVSPPRTASETDTTSSARGRTSSEWPSSTPQSDSHGTQATSLHSSQNTDENVKLGDSNSYPSSLATGDSSFGDSSSSEDERGRKGKEEDDEQEDAEDEDKVWKEKCDLGGGLSAHKPLNRQCLIYVKASFLPSTMNNRRQPVESSDEEEDVPPEDPRMFFEELKMLRALERSSDMRYLSRLKQQNAERVLAWRDTTTTNAATSDAKSPFSSDSEHTHDSSLPSASVPSSRRSSALMSSFLGRRRRSSNNFHGGGSTHGHGIFSSLNPFATAPSTSGSKRSSRVQHPAASGSEATSSSAMEDNVGPGSIGRYPSSMSIASRARTRSATSLHSQNRRRKSNLDGTDASIHSSSNNPKIRHRSSGLHLHLPHFFGRASHAHPLPHTLYQDVTSEDDGMTSGDTGTGDGANSRRASVPVKSKSRRSSFFSRQRPSLPSSSSPHPNSTTYPIGLDPLVNKSAVSSRLVSRGEPAIVFEDTVSVPRHHHHHQQQQLREQEVRLQGQPQSRPANFSAPDLPLGNGSGQRTPMAVPDLATPVTIGQERRSEMDDDRSKFKSTGGEEEDQFAIPALPAPIPIPNPSPASDPDSIPTFSPIHFSSTVPASPSDPTTGQAPVASFHVPLPLRTPTIRIMKRNKSRKDKDNNNNNSGGNGLSSYPSHSSLFRKAWNRLTCQPPPPLPPVPPLPTTVTPTSASYPHQHPHSFSIQEQQHQKMRGREEEDHSTSIGIPLSPLPRNPHARPHSSPPPLRRA